MNGICEKLKELRKQNGLSVQDVLDKLQDYGITVGDKAFYHWEAGRRQPDADTFFALCQIYGVDSFDVFKETKKSPAPEGAGEKEFILLDETNDLLVELGYIQKGQQLSDADLAFLEHWIGLLDAWFRGK
jgi:transcriptional regulator with XRE-family HTH domain